MTPEKYPRGWSEARVRRVLEYYESQGDEEVAAEIEAGFESTTMQVPRALVPTVRELIAKRKVAGARKMLTPALQRTSRARRESKSQTWR